MKTAVEFYREELNALISLRESNFKTEQEIFEQAKEMEKEHLIYAYNFQKERPSVNLTSEQYYYETFKQQETIEEIAEGFYSEQSKAYEDAIEPMFDNSRYLVAGFIDGAKWQQEQAKAMEKEHLQTHKYTESDLINAFEYGWNQYGWNKQQYGIMDEDKIHRIQKRLIQSINETKQQEQCKQQ
jgi:hypothetical protein